MALIVLVLGGVVFLGSQVLMRPCACTTAPDPTGTPVVLVDRSS